MTYGCATSRAPAHADRIRELLAGGVDMPTIAARVKRTPRRVQDVGPIDPVGRHRAPEETLR